MANLLHVFKSFLFCLRGKGNDNLAFIQEPSHFFLFMVVCEMGYYIYKFPL